MSSPFSFRNISATGLDPPNILPSTALGSPRATPLPVAVSISTPSQDENSLPNYSSPSRRRAPQELLIGSSSLPTSPLLGRIIRRRRRQPRPSVAGGPQQAVS